jgi:hypothetical protein
MEPTNYTPTLPEPSTEPVVSPPPANQRKRRIIIAVVIVLVLLGIVMLVSSLKNSSTDIKGDKNYSASNFKDWLAPPSEITVGDSRYVSPCQVLTAKNIANNFGSFADDGYVTEKYLDSSVTQASDQVVDTNCSYFLNNKSIDTVTLVAKQYTNVNDTRNLSQSTGLSSSSINEAITRYKKAADSSDRPEVKALVATMEKSAQTFEKYEDVSGEESQGVDFNGLIVPDTQAALGHEFKLTFINNNVVYSLSATLKGGPDSSLDYTDKQVAIILAGLDSALTGVKQNLKNTSLSQSPVATITGKSEKVGSTRILEPCAVMTPAIFKDISGQDQNNPVSRNTVVYTAEKDRTTKSGYPTLATNGCTREYKSGKGGDGFSASATTSAKLDLSYASTVERAKKNAEGTVGTSGATTDLQTDADWARSLPLDEDSRLYIFRVGTYVGSIDISTLSSDGLGSDIVTTQADQNAHIKAINELVKSLKAQK